MWFTVKKLKKQVYGIGEFKHPEEVISYLIVCKKRNLLIDTGLGIKNISRIITGISQNPVAVINTHSHFDHIGGNKYFRNIVNKESEIIEIKPFVFQIIKTPGHSPDSICIFEKNKGWLFSGDTLYPAPIYLHLKESNLNDYKKSLKKLLKLKISRIFPGHDDFSFPILNIEKIYNLLSGEVSLKKKEIVDERTSLLLK